MVNLSTGVKDNNILINWFKFESKSILMKNDNSLKFYMYSGTHVSKLKQCKGNYSNDIYKRNLTRIHTGNN